MANRIQVDVHDVTVAAFAKFKSESGMSKGAVVDRSVAVYERLLKEAACGNRLVIIDSLGKEKEIILL